MHIVLIHESVPFDGNSPMAQPLGGVEKSVVGLARALVKRNHQVTVINTCAEATTIDGVQWLPWESPRPPEADVLIALRKPSLLGEVPNVEKRVLWLTTNAKYLNKARNQALMDKYEPTLLFMSRAHKETWNPWKEFKTAVIAPGVGDTFLAAQDDENAEVDEDLRFPAKAVVTTHPLHGLSAIVEAWTKMIHARVSDATLHVFSNALYKGLNGGEVPEELKPVFNKVMAAVDSGVTVEKPLSDPRMAAFYRDADVHLYPRIDNEMYCFTLAESQACGLPAVAFDKGAATERMRNGQTGFVVPDISAFANVTVHLMTNNGAHANMARDARLTQRGRSWDVAAAEFELIWS
jgi:glycosyltransferase involved in cell wall biosynthesis